MANKTQEERLATVKAMLGITDTSEDSLLNTYLTFCKEEIISQIYSQVGIPETVTDIPVVYEGTLVNAVIAGYNLRGGENESGHSENGINRSFRFTDTTDYIRNNVAPIVKFL